MTGLYIAGGILLLLGLLLFAVPLHLTVTAGDGVKVGFRILFVSIPVYPAKEKVKKKKKTSKKRKKATKAEKKTEKPSKGGDILALISLIREVAGAVLHKLVRHLCIRIHAYEIAVCTEDAAKTALLCGACRAASDNLFALLSEAANFKVKEGASVGVYPDFMGEKSRCHIKIDFYTYLFGGLSTLLAAGLAFAKNKNQTAK